MVSLPLVDIFVKIDRASVNQDKHEGEENKREVCRRYRHKHVESAEIIWYSEACGNSRIEEYVEHGASSDEEDIDDRDLVRRDENFHIGHDN